MTNMAAIPVHGKKTFKLFFFGTSGPIALKCVALGASDFLYDKINMGKF